MATSHRCKTITGGLYEIHCGLSRPLINDMVNHTGDIGWRHNNVSGTYLHNIFMNSQYRQQFLQSLGWQGQCVDWHEFIENQLNVLSSHPKITALVDAIHNK